MTLPYPTFNAFHSSDNRYIHKHSYRLNIYPINIVSYTTTTNTVETILSLWKVTLIILFDFATFWNEKIIYYRIALNFGGAKLWRIWRIAFLSPNITLQNSPNCAQ